MSEETVKTVCVAMTEAELEMLMEVTFSLGFDELSDKLEDALADIRRSK